MVSDYKPVIPDWSRQHYELDKYLAEMRARSEEAEKEAIKRRARYFAGVAVCWLAAALVLLALSASHSKTRERHRSLFETSYPFNPAPPRIAAPSAIISARAGEVTLPLLAESNRMKRLLDRLGAVEVRGSLYTHTGESYRGSLWVRKVTRGETTYLEDAEHYSVDGPFRLRLPADSTVYVYAPVEGLDWNGGWGAPVQVPPLAHCSQPVPCAFSLRDILIASATRYKRNCRD